MNLLHERTETRRRICSKLAKHFVSSLVLTEVQSAMMRAWAATDGNIKAVLRAMFTSPAFWYPSIRGSLVKGSFEFAIGLVQRLGHAITLELVENIAWRLNQMGQSPFNPPNPAGYATGLRLSAASMLIARYQYAHYLIYDIDATRVSNRLTLGLTANLPSDAFITEMARRLGVRNLSTTTRGALNAYLGNKAVTSASLKDASLGVLYLLACSPEYQLS